MRTPFRRGLVALSSWLFVPCVASADSRWPAIIPSELAATRPAFESDADAEGLLWTVRITDGVDRGELTSVREYYFRVKVYTAAGAQRWSKRDLERPASGVGFGELEARTISPDGSVHAMARKAVSEETTFKSGRRRFRRTSFALPNVQPGCIVEYRFKEYWSGEAVAATFLPLQMDIPVRRIEYRVSPLNLPGVRPRQLTFHTPARPSARPVSGYFETIVENQRAFRQEPDMPPKLQQQAFIVAYYTTDEARDPRAFWTGVGRAAAEWFNGVTKPDSPLRADAARITAGATNDRDRVRRIAVYLQENFRVVREGGRDSLAVHGLREVKDARGAWRQRGGSILDAALAFAALVRASGLEARWMKVPRRSEIFFDSNMLLESFLDSWEVAVRLDGSWVTFDPSTKYLPWDMQDWDEEATSGLLCDRDSSRFIGTSWSQPEQSVRSRRADLGLSPDGTLAGTLHVTCGGHFNAKIRDNLEGLAGAEADSVLARTESEAELFEVRDVTIENADRPREPLRWGARFTLPGFATVTGKRILLEPSVFSAHAKPRFTSSQRTHPVYFSHPWLEADTVVIRLPEGWLSGTATTPQPVLAEGTGDYESSLAVSGDGRTLTFVRRLRMGVDGAVLFPVESYAGLRQLFEQFQARDGFTVELTHEGSSP